MTTEWSQIEPNPGFGKNMFGNPSRGKKLSTGEDSAIIAIHERGFGDPKTNWSNVPNNATVWTEV
jgi:hypothetical protein